MPRSTLWEDPVFRRIWTAHSISQVGSAVTQFALPLLAVQTLGATKTQVGLLLGVGTIPLLVLGLFIGAWTDRRRRLPLMIVADLARMLLVAVIPIAWLLDALSLGLLFGVVILVGLFSVLFDVASQALVTSVLPRDQLIAGNARMRTSYAIADVAGPSGAGLLVRAVSIPFAFAVDALSFGLSAMALIGVHTAERRDAQAGDKRLGHPLRAVLTEIRVGLEFVLRTETLRTLTIGVALWNLFTCMSQAMLILYLLETLSFDEITIGLVTAAGGFGVLAGTLLPNLITERLGLGHGITLALALSSVAYLVVALATGPFWLTLVLVLVGYVIQELANSVADINQFSLRNAVTPDQLRGRVASAARVILRSTVPIGFLLGGLVADHVGLRAAIVLGAVGPLLFGILILRSPIMSLRTLPPDPDDAISAVV